MASSTLKIPDGFFFPPIKSEAANSTIRDNASETKTHYCSFQNINGEVIWSSTVNQVIKEWGSDLTDSRKWLQSMTSPDQKIQLCRKLGLEDLAWKVKKATKTKKNEVTLFETYIAALRVQEGAEFLAALVDTLLAHNASKASLKPAVQPTGMAAKKTKLLAPQVSTALKPPKKRSQSQQAGNLSKKVHMENMAEVPAAIKHERTPKTRNEDIVSKVGSRKPVTKGRPSAPREDTADQESKNLLEQEEEGKEKPQRAVREGDIATTAKHLPKTNLDASMKPMASKENTKQPEKAPEKKKRVVKGKGKGKAKAVAKPNSHPASRGRKENNPEEERSTELDATISHAVATVQSKGRPLTINPLTQKDEVAVALKGESFGKRDIMVDDDGNEYCYFPVLNPIICKMDQDKKDSNRRPKFGEDGSSSDLSTMDTEDVHSFM